MFQSSTSTLILAIFCFLLSCGTPSTTSDNSAQPVYEDVPFWQEYSVKYYVGDENVALKKVAADWNGVIKVLATDDVLHLRHGDFLYPGELVHDGTYRTSAHKHFAGLTRVNDQLVYLDDEAVLSHAWAGHLFAKHELPNAHLVAGTEELTFLISDGSSLQLLQDNAVAWTGTYPNGPVLDIQYDPNQKKFYLLAAGELSTFTMSDKQIKPLYQGTELTAFAVTEEGKEIVVGTKNGYYLLDAETGKPNGALNNKLPATTITNVTVVNGNIWFGTTMGAFMLREDGKYNYYYGERWLPGEEVVDISAGEGKDVLILTNAGLGIIKFKELTLHDKAVYYEDQVRKRHIRLGFNASLNEMQAGDLSTGYLDDSDNDGLWTSMYLGAEVFRYVVTKEEEALQNVRESLDAMERLYTINPVPGFPSRSFERRGYIEHLDNPDRWQHAEDPEWDWKATTSSDEAIGHVFVFGVVAELIEDDAIKQQAVQLLDTLMQHVLDNDLYLVDYDGKPTTWGRWNPEYVNARPKMVGDRKLNSSNLIGMLQTAYHFTGKEAYKDKAYELMEEHGYLENLLRPLSEIGTAPEDADDWSRMLSQNWNHSDDEMYFLGYWGLYRYAFTDSLKTQYKAAIIDHWEAERPEKEGAWNIFTAMTGTSEFDLEEAIWYLQEYPLDLIDWTVKNSHRQDIEKITPNFREQSTTEVLPPDEVRVARHNANRFSLDGGRGGRSEYSAGDIWLLPYWMGRYLGVISAPVSE